MLITAGLFRAVGALAPVFLAFFVAGCGPLRSYQQAPAILLNQSGGDDLSARPFNLMTDCMPGDLAYDQSSRTYKCGQPTLLKFSDTSISATEQAVRRNRFQDYLLWMSEKVCVVHKAGITSGQAVSNFGFDTVTTATGAVGGIVLAPAANILSTIAAISSGTRGHLNEDVYQQYLGPVIIRQINTTRDQMILAIMAKRGSTPPAVIGQPAVQASTPATIESYSVEEAVTDVERYHHLCSVSVALSGLLGANQQFSDTGAGLSARIAVLLQQQTANTTQLTTLRANKPDVNDPGYWAWQSTVSRLQQANEDISRQINILQQQMLTAPLTVTSSGGKSP